MAFAKMTPERYAAIVRAFVAVGGPVFARVAREAGVDRETCKKAWEVGWPDLGSWAKPISADFKTILHPAASEPVPAEPPPAAASVTIRDHISRDHIPTVTPHVANPPVPADGAPGASASEAPSPPTTPVVPSTTPATQALTVAPAPNGMDPRLAKARDLEPALVLAQTNLAGGLGNAVNRVIKAFTDKAHLLDHLGEVGDGKGGYMKDPHAAKHYIEALTSMIAGAHKLAETTLKVMEASRLNAGEAQSISEERTTRPRDEDSAATLARMARMAEVALSMQKGRAIADSYHHVDEKPAIDAEFTTTPTPPEPTE